MNFDVMRSRLGCATLAVVCMLGMQVPVVLAAQGPGTVIGKVIPPSTKKTVTTSPPANNPAPAAKSASKK